MTISHPLPYLIAWPARSIYLFNKRCTDIGLSLICLLLLSPLFLYIMIKIKTGSPGPIFFTQWRSGHLGKRFLIFKFRTLHTEYCHATGGIQITSHDKRLTLIGQWLRQYSFDELPQLINVLRGDMSLVGPRPHAVDHHEYYTQHIRHYERRLSVLPGLTGLAQIAGYRGETPRLSDMQQRFDQDYLYILQQSYRLDTKILWHTLRYQVWRCRPM